MEQLHPKDEVRAGDPIPEGTKRRRSGRRLRVEL
jgi:hypothetical protein